MLKLLKSYFLRSGNWLRKLIIVGTNAVCVTRSRSTVSQKCCGLKFRNRDLARTKSRRRKHERKIDDVKHRRRVKINAAFFVGRPVIEEVDVGQHVGVTHRDTLRVAGRAARVDEGQDRFGVINCIRSWFVGDFQRLLVEHQLPGQPHAGDWQRGVPDQASRARIREHMVDFGGRETRIQRDRDDPQPAASVD